MTAMPILSDTTFRQKHVQELASPCMTQRSEIDAVANESVCCAWPPGLRRRPELGRVKLMQAVGSQATAISLH